LAQLVKNKEKMIEMILVILGFLLILGIPLFYMVKHIRAVIKKEYIFNLRVLRLKDNKLKFKKDFEKHKLPIIRLTLYGVEYNFLLDSGADVNMFNKDIFNNIKTTNNLEELPNSKVTTGSGIEESTKCTLNFDYDNYKFREEFVLMPMTDVFTVVLHDNNIQLHGVLGSKFFTTHQWELDFNNMVIWTKS